MACAPYLRGIFEKEQKLINDERKKNRTEWKHIVNNVFANGRVEKTKRLEVPGGWIYEISSSDGLTSVFVPNKEIDSTDVLEDYDA